MQRELVPRARGALPRGALRRPPAVGRHPRQPLARRAPPLPRAAPVLTGHVLSLHPPTYAATRRPAVAPPPPQCHCCPTAPVSCRPAAAPRRSSSPRDQTCPVSTGEGTRRVRLVRGRACAGAGRRGGAPRAADARGAGAPCKMTFARGARAEHVEVPQRSLQARVPPHPAPPRPRTKRTRHVPSPVLTGHVSSRGLTSFVRRSWRARRASRGRTPSRAAPSAASGASPSPSAARAPADETCPVSTG